MKKLRNFFTLYIMSMFMFINRVSADGCSETLASEDLVEEIVSIFHIVGYVALAIGVVLGMLDFFKVIVGGDKAELKTVGIKFIKRLLAIALFFILPAIVEWLLGISGVTHGGTCLNDTP